MPDPTAHICRGCGGHRNRGQYLCRPCWWTLPDAARTALNKKDQRAVRRLADLHVQLRQGVPLNEIEITS